QIVSLEAYNPAGEDTEIQHLVPDSKGYVYTSYKQNTLHITFTVKDFSQSGRVEYSYLMKGLNDEWYYIDNDDDVVFRGLRPGNYTFILRAKLKSQDWEEASITQIKIRIKPPFWLSWWAYLLYALLLGTIVWILMSTYKRKLQLENSLELERRDNLQKEELNEERLRFFTNITHELRTPLTLILGPLEDLVNDNQLSETYHKKLELINKSAGRLRDLINQILEFRKTETQNRQLTVAKGDLGTLVTEIGQYYKQLNRNPQVAVNIAVSNKVPPVYFDSEVISSIISNLMSNAVKYTEKGFINLSLDTDDHDQAIISVEDSGYGIAPDALDHIFDRYYQAKGEHQASGTGIGLALVKSLADLHQGTLTVDSQLGKGTKFSFAILTDNTYPNALHKEDRDEETEKESDNSAMADYEDDQRPVLLVVEDNSDIRQYIANSMGDDFQILQAADGVEGLEIALENIPDIIVSDIMMPKMNGIDLTRRLKEDINTSHIPIILLTAKDSVEDKQEGYESGADSYLTKPFSSRLLQSRINNLLSGRRHLAELILQRSQNTTTANSPALYPTDEKPQLNRLDREFIDKMNRVIQENIDTENLDMAFMTDKMAMSHSTFYRKVKALTGMTAKEYIRKLRLQRCAQLLASGDYNVSEAASMTGFNDLGHFREVFKKEYGVAPSDYSKNRNQR
ncbi:MAG: response regulator, partial [Prevotella sp.]|nr:response regulator [Prevotella sp.]